MIRASHRVRSLPPYPFAELEAIISERRRRGEDLVDLSIGDPDLPPPDFVVEAAAEALRRPEFQGYSSSAGEPEFRDAVADWYAGRFGVDLDPYREICVLLGCKEGLVNLARTIVNPGDAVLCPDPAYPVYARAALLSDAKAEVAPLSPLDFGVPLEALTRTRARLVYMNYPNNPTGATTSLDRLQAYVDVARERGLLLAFDNAYSELAFDPRDGPSILEAEGAKACAVEFHSLSKTFGMTGYRLGMAVGNPETIAALVRVKSQVDSGAPKFLQRAGAEALRQYRRAWAPKEVRDAARTYKERLEMLVRGLNARGFEARVPRGTFYLWQRTPNRGLDFARALLQRNVVVTPGDAFGEQGRDHVRWSVTQSEETLQTALERLDGMEA